MTKIEVGVRLDGPFLPEPIEVLSSTQEGFSDATVRTVTENAKTLKFSRSAPEPFRPRAGLSASARI